MPCPDAEGSDTCWPKGKSYIAKTAFRVHLPKLLGLSLVVFLVVLIKKLKAPLSSDVEPAPTSKYR